MLNAIYKNLYEYLQYCTDVERLHFARNLRVERTKTPLESENEETGCPRSRSNKRIEKETHFLKAIAIDSFCCLQSTQYSNNSSEMVTVRKQNNSVQTSNSNTRILPYVLVGACVMHATFLFLQTQVPSWEAAPEFCPDDAPTKCLRPDLMAFQMISGMVFVVCTAMGIYAWYGSRTCHSSQRLFAQLPVAQWLTLWNLTYQIWDFGISFVIPEFKQPILFAHHAAAATVAYAVLRYNMLGYYAIFFMGLSEVSSIFLVVIDLGRYIPPEAGTYYDLLVHHVCAPLFVVTFFYYRVLSWWFPITTNLLQDVSGGLKHPKSPKWVMYLLLLLDIPMGVLQLYWMTLILQTVKSQMS